MLNFMTELLVVLSIFIQFSIMNGILIYKKDSEKNEKIVFYIVLFLIYIIIQISRLFNGGNYFSNINYLFYILAFIAWGGYYNYFYKMGYIKYSIFFYLFMYIIHISEPTRQAEISYAVFCLKKKNYKNFHTY
ncbi:sensor histidine kinase virs [Clostridium difficile BI1] [Clostridioides difficile]|nr:sensor histidine kinase virs [Clostridium difficile BI1] [Clostridioides difficile]